MSPYLPRAARNYVEQLRRALGHLGESERAQVLADTRNQIRALPGRGRRRSDLVAALGEPAALALKFEHARPEELKVTSGRRFLTRILAWPIFAFALATAGMVLFSPYAPPPAPWLSGGGMLARLEELMGAQFAWLAFIPVVFSLLPLVLRGVAGTVIQALGALAASAMVIAGGGFGLQFAPVALLLWAQVFTPLLMMRGSMARPGPSWLVTAAVVLVLLVAWCTWQGLSGFDGPAWLVLSGGGLLVVLAVLLPFRWLWAHVALIISGLLVIIAGLAAALPAMYSAQPLWPWLAGGFGFGVGHLSLAADLWHSRARKLLALF